MPRHNYNPCLKFNAIEKTEYLNGGYFVKPWIGIVTKSKAVLKIYLNCSVKIIVLQNPY